MFQLLRDKRHTDLRLVFGLVAVMTLLLLPTGVATAQDLVVGEGEEEVPDADASARSGYSDQLKVTIVGTVQTGGASGGRPGPVAVTLSRNLFQTASQTYDVSLPTNWSQNHHDAFTSWVRSHSGATVFLRGHLHGGSPRPYMHVEQYSSSHGDDSMTIDFLDGKLIDQRGAVFAGGEGTDFAVEATHNNVGTPIRFSLVLSGGMPARINRIRIQSAPVDVHFITSPSFVIQAHHGGTY